MSEEKIPCKKAPYKTTRRFRTTEKTTTKVGKREYQRLYMRQYRKRNGKK